MANAFEANQPRDILSLTECEKMVGRGGGDREEHLQRSCVHLESMTVKSQSCSDIMAVRPESMACLGPYLSHASVTLPTCLELKPTVLGHAGNRNMLTVHSGLVCATLEMDNTLMRGSSSLHVYGFVPVLCNNCAFDPAGI